MTACFHCGLPVPADGRWRAQLLGAEREFCCAGCEAVAGTIAGAGLESYYATRAALPLLDAVIRARERTPTTFYAYACVEAAALYAQTGDRMKAAVLYGDAVDVYGADQRTKEIARRALMQLTTP